MVLNKVRLEEMLENINAKRPLSCTVLIREKGETVLEKCYGYANRGEGILNTIGTRFGIASGCKVFTAVALAQLVERGLTSFDTLLKDCLDVEFPHFHSGITLAHLLTHTSGIPDYFDEEIMEDFSELWRSLPMYNIKSPKDFLPLFQNKQMYFTPGQRFKYSNSGFIVLGLVIEKLAGVSFREYVEKEIFARCGMVDSGYFSLDQLPGRTAYGYLDGEDGSMRTNFYSIPIIGGPDGGAFTTAYDMLKFWRGLLTHKLLQPEMTWRLLTPYAQEEDGEYYGYGVWISQRDGEIFKYHLMGGDPGVVFRSAVYPEYGIELVFLGNFEHGGYATLQGLENLLVR